MKKRRIKQLEENSAEYQIDERTQNNDAEVQEISMREIEEAVIKIRTGKFCLSRTFK